MIRQFARIYLWKIGMDDTAMCQNIVGMIRQRAFLRSITGDHIK